MTLIDLLSIEEDYPAQNVLLEEMHRELQAEHERLQQEHERLRDMYKELQGKYKADVGSRDKEIEQLGDSLRSAEREYESEQSLRQRIEGEKTGLQKRYDDAIREKERLAEKVRQTEIEMLNFEKKLERIFDKVKKKSL